MSMKGILEHDTLLLLFTLDTIKSSLPKSMVNTSHWTVFVSLSFSTSQVDLTHNDDYVVTIVNITSTFMEYWGRA